MHARKIHQLEIWFMIGEPQEVKEDRTRREAKKKAKLETAEAKRAKSKSSLRSPKKKKKA